MTLLENVQLLDKTRKTFEGEDTKDAIDCSHLLALPALIDPHVHFRTPGHEHKENWISAAKAAIHGGIGFVLDMPNNAPSCIDLFSLQQKQLRIDEQLKTANIPLRYRLYLGADEKTLEEIPLCKKNAVALKIYMGPSTGTLLMQDPKALDRSFQIAKEHSIPIAVHAEDEAIMKKNARHHVGEDPSLHSKIRSDLVAAKATEQAIELCAKYQTTLYVVHVSTKKELALIRSAKKQGLPVYAEATPHHLFLNDAVYPTLKTKALVNPPLRSKEEQEALLEALFDGTIDCIGTDHAPHLLEEKNLPYGKAPAGFPSIELLLPLLLTAHKNLKLPLERIVELTHHNPKRLFSLPATDDWVFVDLEETRCVEENKLFSKAGWSPYAGFSLTGWPHYMLLQGRILDVRRS